MLRVVFEDDSLLVLDKPPGLVVTSSETSKEDTLEDLLRSDFGIKIERGGIVHRLDKDTSGLIVVAKTQGVLENLQAQFKERVVKKEYLALVHGFIEEKGIVDAPIARNPGDREKFTAIDQLASQTWSGVREAVTEYEPLQRLEISEKRIVEIFPDFNKIQLRKLNATRYTLFTLLRCKPHTGRTHQIRVHLKYIGHPIVGDDKYGGRKVVRLDHRFCPRQFLHAARLEFNHPATGKRMSFESKLPEDLKKALDKLEVKSQTSKVKDSS